MNEYLLRSLIVSAEQLKESVAIDTPYGLHICNANDYLMGLPNGELACVPSAFFQAITMTMPGESPRQVRIVDLDGDKP